MKFKHKDSYVKLGLTIAYYRKLNNMTQETLAEAIGIDRTHLGNLETARTGFSLDVLFDIAEALELPAAKLLEFRD